MLHFLIIDNLLIICIIYYYRLSPMDPEESFAEQIGLIYGNKEDSPQVKDLIKYCWKRHEHFLVLLKELNSAYISSSLCLANWSNFARQLIRLIRHHKNQKDLALLTSHYFVKLAHHFFPYPLTSTNYKNFLPLLKISKSIQIAPPSLTTATLDQKHIIMFLNNNNFSNEDNREFVEKIVEIINSQVWVDKKNWNPKMLRVCPLFSDLFAKEFASFVPSIERLMIRSQNNLEVIAEVLESVGPMPTLKGEHVLALLKKYKNLFLTKPEPSLKLVKTLTQSLHTDEEFSTAFQFIKTLINSEHNAKKKIIYIRMLEGYSYSLREYKLCQKLVCEVIAVVASSWIKFVEESQMNFVFEILGQLLPLVKEGNPVIAEACKVSLKNQNRYILVATALTLSACYKSAENFDELPAVKECFTTIKSLLPGFMKKKEANWHFILPFLSFLSTYDLELMEDLTEISFILKKSVLALNRLQQVDLLKLLATKFIKYQMEQQKDEEDGEKAILSKQFCITFLILMESVGNQMFLWKEIAKEIPNEVKLEIIHKGLFPLLYLEQDVTVAIPRNKGNRFNSLARFMLFDRKIKYQEIKDKEGYLESFCVIAAHCNIELRKVVKSEGEGEEKEEFQEAIKKIGEKYLKLAILPQKLKEMGDKYYMTVNQSEINLKVTHSVIENTPIPILPLINSLLAKILDKNCYEKDREFLIDFEESLTTTVKTFFESQLQEEKATLTEMQYYNEPKIAQKKVYLNAIFDAKMMSEEEVKQEKYLEHFNQMLHYYDKICIDVILPKIVHFLKGALGVDDLWGKNFEQFVRIGGFPQHRNVLLRIVKASFENVCIPSKDYNESKVTNKLQNLFLRYAGFFSEFYAIRGAHLTPSISLMQKSQKFYKELLDFQITLISKGHYVITFIEDLSLYVLENMQFDLEVKNQALNFCQYCISRGFQMENQELLYTFMVKNINIIASCENSEPLLLHCMERIPSSRYHELFIEILSYVNKTKILILNALVKICKNVENEYSPTFEDYIKLRILALDDSLSEEISSLSSQILECKSEQTANISVTIAHFDMKNFIKNNSKETIEKLCKFMTESINNTNINDVMELVLRTAAELYDEHFDQEGLEFLPYFLSLNIDQFPDKYLHKIFEILVLKYTSNEEYVTLSNMSVEIGIQIIKRYANTHGEKLLLSMESFLTKAKGISNIVFLGVLAPFLKGNKNLNVIEKRITELFKGNNQNQQKAIAKCMPDLMSFFRNPDKIVEKILEDLSEMNETEQVGQCYLCSGLLKGLGHKPTLVYLEKIISKEYPSKSKGEKSGRICLIQAFVDNFGRVIELRGKIVIEILLHYMSDSNEQIRNFAKTVTQSFVTKMSSFAIKELLPHLLSGLENEQNWRIKISYIWILGIMANCAAKQLQTSLPIIVPTLSACLSNAHPNIRDKASQALKLIGETIKNPEISNSTDVLIEALENPFEKSGKAIELLLKTRFSHYIDPPSLSMIVPIVDYCLRGRVSELKEFACQVIGSISELILKPADMLPYLKYLAAGMRVAVCDPLPEIRSIAAMAIGKISSKIGADYAKIYFGFIFEIIDSFSSNTTEKTGAAQAYAQVICSQDFDYFEESLQFIFSKLTEDTNKSIQKEGYILIFLYVPTIRRAEFEGFIKQVNENTYCYVSDEQEALRNSSMQVSKVLINNYGISHTDLLIEPLCEAIFESNWRKRNAALILLGELLNILKLYMFNAKTNDKIGFYYQALMAVYIMKDDELEMPRVTANQVWNMYIENTPKTIKSGLKVLVRMWTRFTHAANGVVFKNIIGFSSKYAENYFTEILEYLEEFVVDPLHKKGVFDVLGELLKRMAKDFLSKNVYKNAIRKFFDTFIFSVDDSVREALTNCLALYIEKMHEQEYFEALLYPSIDKMDEETEENPEYIEMLHLLRDLLKTTSNKVVDRLISKVIEQPLSEFKIEVITNNADKICNNLYTLFKVPSTVGMLEEAISLLTPENKADKKKANRLLLLTYCLNQVSVKLNNKFKSQYVHMLMQKVRYLKNKKDDDAKIKEIFLDGVDLLLGMLTFFLQAIDLKEIESLEELIGEITPYVFLEGHPQITKNAHKIFMILISDNKDKQTGIYYKQMIVSLENQRVAQKGYKKAIWHEEQTIRDYISVLVSGLAYGTIDNLHDCLELLSFFIANTTSHVLSMEIIKIVGPLVRTASYTVSRRLKERLLTFLKDLYQSQFKSKLEIYNYQTVSVCLRILTEMYANVKLSVEIVDVIEQIADTLYAVIEAQENNRTRELLLDFIISRAKGEELVELLYFLIKNIITKNPKMIPNQTYIKIENQFVQELVNPVNKMSVKGVYMMSKIAAMIYVFLGRDQDKQEEGEGTGYEDLLFFLQKCSEKKIPVNKSQKIELMIRESSREKAYYLLKSLHECREANIRTKEIFTLDYVNTLVPESLSGFDDIKDILEYYE